MNKLHGLIFICLYSFFWMGACASKNHTIEAKRDMTIYVIDENNKPVPDYYLECKSVNGSVKWKSITDGDGCWKISDARNDSYVIRGSKNGWVSIAESTVEYTGEEVFFCKTVSCDYVLGEALELFKRKDYSAGIKKLNQLYVTGDTLEAAVVCFYKAVAYKQMGKKRDFKKEYEKFQKFTVFPDDTLKKILVEEENEIDEK